MICGIGSPLIPTSSNASEGSVCFLARCGGAPFDAGEVVVAEGRRGGCEKFPTLLRGADTSADHADELGERGHFGGDLLQRQIAHAAGTESIEVRVVALRFWLRLELVVGEVIEQLR